LSTIDSTYVRDLVRTQAAIVLDESKQYLIEARLNPLAREEGVASITDLVASLRNGTKPALRDKIVDALTTNETSWFRDRAPFDALREVVLPKLIEARAKTRTLTIWCGAASTGQEPYSLAILLREHFPQLAGWHIRILATDISKVSLAQAREALYGQMEMNRGLPAPLLSKYFTREGTKFRLNADIRKMVEYRECNLVGQWQGIPQSDLVMMRNVLIYFAPPTKAQVLNRLATQVLRPDGVLMLGGAETTHNLTTHFVRAQRGSFAWYEMKGSAG
jgi:chemotaxis protein methyltransferase CheR